MVRAEDFDQDEGLTEALAYLDSAHDRLGDFRDSLFMLRAAYDEVAVSGIANEGVGSGAHPCITMVLGLFFEGSFAV